MEAELHDSAHKPRRIECTRIVVRDQFGQPQVAIMSPAPDQIWVTHRGEEGWERALQAMGVNDTCITHVVNEGVLPKPPGKLMLPGTEF